MKICPDSAWEADANSNEQSGQDAAAAQPPSPDDRAREMVFESLEPPTSASGLDGTMRGIGAHLI